MLYRFRWKPKLRLTLHGNGSRLPTTQRPSNWKAGSVMKTMMVATRLDGAHTSVVGDTSVDTPEALSRSLPHTYGMENEQARCT
jgi:hypothetical protein